MERPELNGYYVMLTGGKNNAGDFLIKHRAKQLLGEIRPDRDLIDLNAWEPLDTQKLEIINGSEALLLTGGPALRYSMYPGIYKLTENLDDIKVPIVTFGIGWKSADGEWEDIYEYNFSKPSKKLIDKINGTGYLSSVRDYHSMHALQKEGYDNFLMTGCPALYDLDSMKNEIRGKKIDKILFSLGANFANSESMEKSVKDILLKLKGRFCQTTLSVLFHHSIDKNYLNTPDANKELFYQNVQFTKWLEENSISYKDISGSADDLMNEYATADLHIGYRVHAHIYMSSISKPSILIAEDGRGKALRSLLGGIILDGYTFRKKSIFLKGLKKFGVPVDLYQVPENLSELILETIEYEFGEGLPRLKTPRVHINNHFTIMEKFLKQLP